MWLPFPTKRPTRQEYQVLFVATSIFFIALGVVAIVLGLRAPIEKHELAHQAIGYGIVSIVIGLIVAAGFWLAQRATRDL
jgi:uncharacterized membrane protein HdeD (DUF308 family)